ncbi:DUF6783 domain-containing protein [uncultured Robinsoniella sp.]
MPTNCDAQLTGSIFQTRSINIVCSTYVIPD